MYSSSFSIGDETFNGRDSSILLAFSSSKQDSSSGQKRLGRDREQFSSIFLHIRLRKYAVFRGKRDLGLEEEDGFILFGGFGAAKSSGSDWSEDFGVVFFSGYTFSVSTNEARFLSFGGHDGHGQMEELHMAS